MSDALPEALGRLLDPKDSSTRDVYWGEFVAKYSRLLLHVTRAAGRGQDPAMDLYAFVLEQLRRDDCRRLRAYVADGRSEFSTWLVVVAQRLCRDYQRHRYGRVRPAERGTPSPDETRALRRRLVDLIGAEVDLSSLVDPSGTEADSATRIADLHRALETALAQLDPRDRLLIKLRFEDDLSMPQVASNLGFATRFHVYRRLKEVLTILRSALRRQGFEDPAP